MRIKQNQWLMILFAALALWLGLSACTYEEYERCEIPKTSALKATCFPSDESPTPSCAVDYVFDCPSQVCGVYYGSKPFCTLRCVPSTCPEGKACDCPKGKDCVKSCPEDGSRCLEWTAGSGEFFCVPKEKDIVKNQSSTKP